MAKAKKLGVAFWKKVANYGNENWRGKFTPREVAELAKEYAIEWESTLEERKVTPIIASLLELLDEDAYNGSNDKEADDLLSEIYGEIMAKDIELFA